MTFLIARLATLRKHVDTIEAFARIVARLEEESDAWKPGL